MAVAALSTAGFSQYVSASSNVSASQLAFQSLQQSLASGNLTAAQTAFSQYQQVNQSAAASSGSAASSQLSTDMASLGSALGSGDLTTAQSAFATVQSDLKSSPPQAVTSAESAATQAVQWIDDLLNLSSTNDADSAELDPTTSILDSVFGFNPSTTSTQPRPSWTAPTEPEATGAAAAQRTPPRQFSAAGMRAVGRA
ncbi:MAG: hypothetical protein ABSF53_14310 [Terracidiphilus sp.]|jgi:hypothetical protein